MNLELDVTYSNTTNLDRDMSRFVLLDVTFRDGGSTSAACLLNYICAHVLFCVFIGLLKRIILLHVSRNMFSQTTFFR